MSWAATIIIIALIAVVGGIIVARKENAPRRRAQDAEREALRREVGDLKARIATLERIATDRPAGLAREIEELAQAGSGSMDPDGTGPNETNGTGTADTDKKD